MPTNGSFSSFPNSTAWWDENTEDSAPNSGPRTRRTVPHAGERVADTDGRSVRTLSEHESNGHTMMKKRFLALPLALGVAGASWAGGTLYGGNEARQAYDRLLADVGDAYGLTLVPSSYQAGFLSSEAVTELRLGGGDEAPTLMRFRHLIEHSPVGDSGLRAARIVTTADISGLDPEIAGRLATLFGDAVPLTVETVIGLGGDAEHAVTVAAWGRDDTTARLAVAPMQWTVNQSGTGVVSGTGSWPGLSFRSKTDPDVEINLGASHDRFDYRQVDGMLYVGDYLAELGDLTASSIGTGTGGALSDMRLSSVADVVGGVYQGNAMIEIASMELPIALDSLRFQVDLDGLPSASMMKMTRAANALSFATFGADEVATEKAMESYLAALASMLRPGLSMGYTMELSNAGGRAVADYDMSWAGQDGLAGLETLGDLVRALRVTATLDVDAEAIALTPAAMFVNPAALVPWIVGDADGYRADIVIDDLIMNVNGQPMPLEAMAGPVLNRPLRELFDEAI